MEPAPLGAGFWCAVTTLTPNAICTLNLLGGGAVATPQAIEAPSAATGNPPPTLASLYHTHYTAIVQYLFRRTGDQHAAEDLAAETFIRAGRGLAKFRSQDCPVEAWLIRIATNEAHRWARRSVRRRMMPLSAVEHAALSDRPVDPPGHFDELLDAFHSLSPSFQDVLSLHYFAHLDVQCIALVLRCRPGSVKSRLARARAALRVELERRSISHA